MLGTYGIFSRTQETNNNKKEKKKKTIPLHLLKLYGSFFFKKFIL